MIDFLRWLVAVEILGLAFLPLTVWLLGRLPDRGYAFAKILALLLVTYLTWIVGVFLPVVGSAILPVAITLAVAAIGWWLWHRRTLDALRDIARLIAAEELLFVAALILWSVLRVFVFHPQIAHTEQFMDMAFLDASFRSSSYPPFDPWMSGHTINYYYFGYLMFATLTKLSGIAPAVGYNLALSTLFAFTLTGAYSIGYALTRRVAWAALAPFFVALIGNWHAILWQVWHGACTPPTPGGAVNTFYTWFWESTRVIGASYSLGNWGWHGSPAICNSATDYTINEYPLFSFILGDLHPHVMGLPFTLLAIGLALSILLAPSPLNLSRTTEGILRIVLLAISIGALFTINSWDLPTYALILAGCVVANAYITDDTKNWWHAPLRSLPAIGILSVALFLPFYLHFKSLAHGLGFVSVHAGVYQFIQVFGLFFLASAVLVGSLALLLQPAEAEEDEEVTESPVPTAAVVSERGSARLGGGSDLGTYTTVVLLLLAASIIGLDFHSWVLVLDLALGGGALFVLRRVVDTEHPNRGDVAALILIAAACVVLALTEVIYLRDAFDGGASYRMNTVFKFYYQAWTLLGLAGAYGAYRGWRILRDHISKAWGTAALGVITLGVLASAFYTVLVPTTSVQPAAAQSLDGLAWIRQSYPGDYAAIQWLKAHAPAGSVELEATGGEYTYTGLISVFTGLPTVMGWAGHEGQWRGSDPEIQTRVTDVQTIYQTLDRSTAESLLKRYHVRYVVVGEQERALYSQSAVQLKKSHGSSLDKFSSFMRISFHTKGVTVYTW